MASSKNNFKSYRLDDTPVSLTLTSILLGTHNNEQPPFSYRHFAIMTFRVFARNLLRGSRHRNIFHICFLMSVLGFEPEISNACSKR